MRVISLIIWLFFSFNAVADESSAGNSRGSESFVFVQLSDLHIPAWESEQDAPQAALNLQSVVEDIKALEPTPDFVIITGDLAAEEGSMSEYLRLKELLSPLPFPIYYALGNHDNRSSFRSVILKQDGSQEPYYYYFKHRGWVFILLDSLVTGEVFGEIDGGQLKWLEGVLHRYNKLPKLIFLHHHLPLGFPGEQPLVNTDELVGVLESAKGVVGVVTGHAHLARVEKRGDLTIFNSASTAYCFVEECTAPAYRIFELNKHGSLKTMHKKIGEAALQEADFTEKMYLER